MHLMSGGGIGPLQRRLRGFGAPWIAGDKDNARTLLRQPDRGDFTDAAGCARDNDGFALHVGHSKKGSGLTRSLISQNDRPV